MKIKIATNAIISAFFPDSIESFPRDGLTDLSSTIFTGAASSQALNTFAISCASFASSRPLMTV